MGLQQGRQGRAGKVGYLKEPGLEATKLLCPHPVCVANHMAQIRQGGWEICKVYSHLLSTIVLRPLGTKSEELWQNMYESFDSPVSFGDSHSSIVGFLNSGFH